MHITIRSENPLDYNAVAQVNLQAFRNDSGDFVAEAVFMDTLRHRRSYDPALSLVAELDERIVGVAMFSPCELYFGGRMVPAVLLGPLAVHPDYQKSGIGGKLLEEGHRRARAKGFAVCLLYGEKDYYPRFGYQPGAFSGRGLCIQVKDLPMQDVSVLERPVEPGDIPAVAGLWHQWHHQEPVAMFPGNDLIDWVSHADPFRASVVVRNDRVAGYIRYQRLKPWSILSYIADGPETSLQMLASIRSRVADCHEPCIHIPVNPFSQVVKERIPCPYTSEIRMSAYAMMKVLDDSPSEIVDYCKWIQNDPEAVGVLNLPAQFEWA